MKLNIKNKKIVIFSMAILIIAIAVGILFYKMNNVAKNDTIIENAYIDIWRDTSMDMDIDLYSIGSGSNEKLYLGAQPLHYLINKSGDIYTYQASSYQNKMTGKRDPAIVEHIKTLSKSELDKLEDNLKSVIEIHSSNSISLDSSYWYIKIDDNSTRVDINVKTNVLNNYI